MSDAGTHEAREWRQENRGCWKIRRPVWGGECVPLYDRVGKYETKPLQTGAPSQCLGCGPDVESGDGAFGAGARRHCPFRARPVRENVLPGQVPPPIRVLPGRLCAGYSSLVFEPFPSLLRTDGRSIVYLLYTAPRVINRTWIGLGLATAGGPWAPTALSRTFLGDGW